MTFLRSSFQFERRQRGTRAYFCNWTASLAWSRKVLMLALVITVGLSAFQAVQAQTPGTGALSGTGREVSHKRPIVGICAAGALQVYAKDTANGWAKTKCAPAPANIPSDANGFALNWREAAGKKADGLTYLTFLVTEKEVGGQIRFNSSPSYRAVVVAHPGGGGTAWPEKTRDGGPGDDSDIGNGVAWSSANLLHHPFFAGARRIWYESATEGHGGPFRDVSGPGFTQVHDELVKTVLAPLK